MEIIDARTGHVIADSAYDPLSHIKPAKGGLMTALSPYILSASGWRNVYAASKDEEDPTTSITDEDALVTAHIAATLFNEVGKAEPRILLAVDARPTGRVLAHITLRVLTGLGAALLHMGVQAIEAQMYMAQIADNSLEAQTALHLLKVTPTVGASGAIYGVLIGFAMLYPDAVLTLIFPPVSLKAKWFVIIFAVIELMTGIFGVLGSVAHFAHLGGMLFGWLLILYWKKKGKLYQYRY